MYCINYKHTVVVKIDRETCFTLTYITCYTLKMPKQNTHLILSSKIHFSCIEYDSLYMLKGTTSRFTTKFSCWFILFGGFQCFFFLLSISFIVCIRKKRKSKYVENLNQQCLFRVLYCSSEDLFVFS